MKGDDEKLMNLSAASADRLLRPAREAMRMKGRSGTRSPGSSLNTMIPIRAYYTMDERCEAGFFEIDTVVHCADTGLRKEHYGRLHSRMCRMDGFIYARSKRRRSAASWKHLMISSIIRHIR